MVGANLLASIQFTRPDMKNIQVIDGAANCVYDIFSAPDADFALIFPTGEDIAFIDEVLARVDAHDLDDVFGRLWSCRVSKTDVVGIHGTLFYHLEAKKPYYATRRDEEARNPDGTPLRASQ
jgi:hypothetical protein